MKKLRKLFRHFGNALSIHSPFLREKVVFSFQDVSLVF